MFGLTTVNSSHRGATLMFNKSASYIPHEESPNRKTERLVALDWRPAQIINGRPASTEVLSSTGIVGASLYRLRTRISNGLGMGIILSSLFDRNLFVPVTGSDVVVCALRNMSE